MLPEFTLIQQEEKMGERNRLGIDEVYVAVLIITESRFKCMGVYLSLYLFRKLTIATTKTPFTAPTYT